MSTNTKLVFDIGMHQGEDTRFYLQRGYKVVAVDAAPSLTQRAQTVFRRYTQNQQLTILNLALYDQDHQQVDFYLSKASVWNSLNVKISNRHNYHVDTVPVQTVKLSSLMQQYGTPYYCKIDIEGYDLVCLKTLAEVAELPQYLSCESECAGEDEQLSEAEALATLEQLHAVGYRQFKLVEQNYLNVLEPAEPFYSRENLVYRTPSLVERSLRRALRMLRLRVKSRSNLDELYQRFGYEFKWGMSGPFGEELGSKWLGYEQARETLLFHRRMFLRHNQEQAFGFWCDWHAKR